MEKKKKLLIIDADSIVWVVAYNFRNKKVKKMVELNVNKFVSDLLTNTGATDYIGFYADKRDDAKPNFRYALYPDYKSNRPDTPDFVKKWRPTILETFKEKWKFTPIEGMESDDAVGIAYNKFKDDYDEVIIATADKDLRQFACTFYDFNKHEMTEIDEFTAAYNLAHQMIMGDSGDHIPGIPGIGKVGAKKLLKDAKTIKQLNMAVARAYYNYWEKQKKAIEKEVLDDYTSMLDDDEKEALDKLTDAKRARKIRLATKTQIADRLEEIFPDGWKGYYCLQRGLLKMLTKEPDWFELDAINESPFKDLESAKIISSEDAKKAIESADDFLII